MATEDYNFGRLRDSLLDEFGYDKTDPILRDVANKKLNDAIAFIVNASDDWPWLVTEDVFDLVGSKTVTANFTNGSRNVSGVIGGAATDQYRVVFPDGSTTQNAGYVISQATIASYTLRSQWLGETGTLSVTIADHLLELPNNFKRMKTLSGGDNSVGTRFRYVTPFEFHKMVNTKQYRPANDYFYTITNDPTGQSQSQFLAIFPYITDQITLFYSYYKSHEIIENDADIPVIPREERLTVLQVAYWFLSIYGGNSPDKIAFYREPALMLMQKMKEDRGYSNDPTEDLNREYPIGWIGMPPGYPEIRGF